MTKDIATVVGENCRKLRVPASMDELADRARKYGMRWNSGSIAKIEAGTHKLTIQSVVILAAALDDLSDGTVRVPDLLATDDAVALSDSTFVQNGWILSEILSGRTTLAETVSDYVDHALAQAMRTASDALQGVEAPRAPHPPGMDLVAVIAYEREASEAERRITRGLNIGWPVAWSHHLWGHSFTAERDRRAGPDANAQKRGQITRTMKTELRQAIEAADGDD